MEATWVNVISQAAVNPKMFKARNVEKAATRTIYTFAAGNLHPTADVMFAVMNDNRGAWQALILAPLDVEALGPPQNRSSLTVEPGVRPRRWERFTGGSLSGNYLWYSVGDSEYAIASRSYICSNPTLERGCSAIKSAGQ